MTATVRPKIKKRILLKLLLTSTILNFTLIGFVVIGMTSLNYRSSVNSDKISLQQNLQQAGAYVNEKIEFIKSISESIMLNYRFNDAVSQTTKDPIQQTEHAEIMRSLLQAVKATSNISNISVYLPDEWNYSIDGQFLNSMSSLPENSLFTELLTFEKKDDFLCTVNTHTNEEYVSFFRIMRSINDYTQISFLLQIDVLKSDFSSFLSNISPVDGCYISLVNSNAEALVSYGSRPDFANEEFLKQLYTISLDEVSIRTYSNTKYMLARLDINQQDWNLIAIVPVRSFFLLLKSYSGSIYLTLSLIIYIITSVIFIVVSYLLITRRITLLSEHIKTSAETNLSEFSEKFTHDDEIGDLYDNYNKMLAQIKKLISANYEMGIELKNAEFEALQAQINPHFLYNTLDMIRWFADQNDSGTVQETVYQLASFYKISLSKGKSLIPVADELKHVFFYVSIQSKRFRNRITYRTDIDPQMLNYLIPKITLQPIVENAISHGILQSPNKCGTILVKGRIEKDMLVFEIIDDGIGMDMSEPFRHSEMAPASGSHYGLSNISNRLRLLYGEEYGLTINSEPNNGTTVRIRIPANSEDEI